MYRVETENVDGVLTIEDNLRGIVDFPFACNVQQSGRVGTTGNGNFNHPGFGANDHEFVCHRELAELRILVNAQLTNHCPFSEQFDVVIFTHQVVGQR